jgi:hypothetical protein
MKDTAENEKLSAGSECAPDPNPLVPTIFHEHWWLKAATGGAYEHVEVADGNRIVGRLPFAVTNRPGRRISGLPTLTHILGPAIVESPGNSYKRFLHRYSITKELINKLPKIDRFRQKLHRGDAEALAFQSEGFRSGIQFTFEIAAPTELEAWNGLRHKTRNVIRRLQDQLDVSEIADPEEFLRFYEQNLSTSGKLMLEPRTQVAAVCAAALEKNAAKIFCAKDASSRLVGAIFLVADAKTAHYLMTTRAADAPNGTVNLLIWHAIRFSTERGLIFDFDGIVKEGAIPIYAAFGGQAKPIYIVSRESKKVKLVDCCRGIIGIFAEQTYFDR